MSTTEQVYAKLSGSAGITALVSDRIYPDIIPQEAPFPCILFEVSDDGGFKDFDGQGETVRTELQLDSIAQTLAEALQIALAAKTELKNFLGAMGTRTVVRTSLETEFSTYESQLRDGKYRVSQAWTLWHY